MQCEDVEVGVKSKLAEVALSHERKHVVVEARGEKARERNS